MTFSSRHARVNLASSLLKHASGTLTTDQTRKLLTALANAGLTVWSNHASLIGIAVPTAVNDPRTTGLEFSPELPAAAAYRGGEADGYSDRRKGATEMSTQTTTKRSSPPRYRASAEGMAGA